MRPYGYMQNISTVGEQPKGGERTYVPAKMLFLDPPGFRIAELEGRTLDHQSSSQPELDATSKP